VLEGAQHNTYDVEFYGPNPDKVQRMELYVNCGKIEIKRLCLGWFLKGTTPKDTAVQYDGRQIPAEVTFSENKLVLDFTHPLTLETGQLLSIYCSGISNIQ